MAVTGNPRFSLLTVAFLSSLGAVLGPSPAYGLACGDTITTDTVLTGDLGPCPGSGLHLLNGTLDIAGFAITGSGGGDGVLVDGSPARIQGPGTITNFSQGIRILTTSGATVQDVNLSDNVYGIFIAQSGGARVINNTINGGLHGFDGIFLTEVTSVKIKGSVITRHSDAGIRVGIQNKSMIVLNSVTGNGNGFVYNAQSDPSPITIRANNFSDNTQHGMSISGGFANLILELNTVSRNGGNGIFLSGSGYFTNLIGDNVVDSNGGQGIAVNGGGASPSYSLQVVDNEVQGNALDLFWSGTGTNTCWKFNIFDTSDPATLPSCP